MKIAIQGIRGSYHHKVAIEFFNKKIQLEECQSFDRLVDSLNNGDSDLGVMAIENSIAGSIIPNYSLIDKKSILLADEKLDLTKEIIEILNKKLTSIKLK